MGAGGRYLIVNADDFGRSPAINTGVITALEHGIVTSASLMVRWPAAVEAAAYAGDRPTFSLGLHVDLGEWAFRGGTWVPEYEVVTLEDRDAVEQEVRSQLDSFRRLVGRDPTHLDSHQHVHSSDPPAAVLEQLAMEIGAHLRHSSAQIRYSGDFYGQTRAGTPLQNGITVERMIEILHRLPVGVTELACHPGEADDIDSPYGDERKRELQVLCHPRVRATVESEQIVACSFSDIPARHEGNV